ncbi:MAG TPA: NAD-dependent deacylase [Gammaproteobacteria bacterium]
MKDIEHIVVFTGAGISAESGLSTFRDNGGLWDKYDVYEIASPQGWTHNPELVLRFYNERLQSLLRAKPNAAHYAIASLEECFKVSVVTQNVDDLHERAGSLNVIHLHGELRKARSTVDPNLEYPMKETGIRMGELCEKGSQLRPGVVWFGEAVRNFEQACTAVESADIFLVVGTSLAVYPAASLVDMARGSAGKYIINPELTNKPREYEWIKAKAAEGVPALVKEWKQKNKKKIIK